MSDLKIDIKAILPHRYPFLMVDAFISQQDNNFECVKNVSFNEPFFQGHFPQEPVMPGVMIIEALAQASAVGLAVKNGLQGGDIGYLAAIEKAKFKHKVVPGDRLLLKGEILLYRRRLCKVKARALVDKNLAAEAELAFMFAANN